MTREQIILAMPADRDMDALIAERVFGMKIEWTTAFDGNPQPFCRKLRDKYDEDGWIPQYSTDMAAAWEVVERIKVFSWSLGWRHHHALGAGWFVTVGENEVTWSGPACPTAPLAVCRAALLATI